MRIVIPNYASSDSFVDNVAHTLRAMGHDVVTFPRPRLPIFSRVGRAYLETRERLQPGFRTPQERWLLRIVRQLKPDALVALTQPIGEDVLAEVKRAGVRRRVVWWGDPAAYIWRWSILTPEWDLVCAKDADLVTRLRLAGLNAHLLHEAMNPDWHRPLSSAANGHVCVAGSWYAFRQRVAERLLGAGVEVSLFGPPVPRWGLAVLRERHSGRFLVREEKSRVFGAALACLNTATIAEGDALNCRAFEIAGAGGLQLIEDRPAIAECFEPGSELWTFRTFEELLALIERARRAPADAAKVRAAGARRAHAEHTYRHRLDRMFSLLEG